MSSLSDQLNQISGDLSNGNQRLLTLVNNLIKENNQASLREVFLFLGNRTVPQVISNSSIEAIFPYINKLSSDKEKLDLLFPVLMYLIPIETLRKKYSSEKDQFIELCKKLNKYYELSQYYLKYEEKNPFDFENSAEVDSLQYALILAESCAKAGDSNNATKYSVLANRHFHSQSCPLALAKKFYTFRFTNDLINKRFNSASNNFLTLFSLDKENPESLEYLRKAAVYAILSNESNKHAQVSKLLNEEKMKKLPICELLEKISKETIITADDMPKFQAHIQNEEGYSYETLKNTILNQNIKAISRFFSSISFQRISQITGEKVEVVLDHLQQLISNQTLKSLIDQPNQFIIFKPNLTEDERKDESISVFCRTLQQFTLQISS